MKYISKDNIKKMLKTSSIIGVGMILGIIASNRNNKKKEMSNAYSVGYHQGSLETIKLFIKTLNEETEITQKRKGKYE